MYLKAEQGFVQWLTLFTMLAPNTDETPASFSFQLSTSLSGSDHSRSQRRPDQYQLKNNENDLYGTPYLCLVHQSVVWSSEFVPSCVSQVRDLQTIEKQVNIEGDEKKQVLPPWQQKILLLMIAATGRQLKHFNE